MKKLPSLIVALMAMAVLAAACGNDDGDTTTSDDDSPVTTQADGDTADDGDGDAGGSLTVYSGRSEDLIQPILDRFEEVSGIDVDIRYGDSADLALLIDTEGDKSPADVFITQSPGSVGFLEGNDRLGDVDAGTLDLVDESFRSGDGKWVGLSGRIRVLVYNTDLVDEADLPSSVLELTDEAYDGRVAVAPTNGSFQDFVTGMRVALGDDAAGEWLDGMAANDAPTYPKNSAIVEAVGRGEVPMGLVNHYYLHLALAENPDLPIANHFFDDGDIGGLVIVTGGAILESSENQAAAQELLAFLLTEEAQRFFADDEFEYPLAAGVEPSGGIPPLTDLPQTTLDLDELGGGLERTAELIQDSGLDR